jgi:hypothetical protein
MLEEGHVPGREGACENIARETVDLHDQEPPLAGRLWYATATEPSDEAIERALDRQDQIVEGRRHRLPEPAAASRPITPRATPVHALRCVIDRLQTTLGVSKISASEAARGLEVIRIPSSSTRRWVDSHPSAGDLEVADAHAEKRQDRVATSRKPIPTTAAVIVAPSKRRRRAVSSPRHPPQRTAG